MAKYYWICSQSIYIYKASIKDNISIFGDYDEEMVKSAAKLANINDFIENLPNKYDTLIGDGGINLSWANKELTSKSYIQNRNFLY